jgi:hypothetical protein
LAEIDAAEEAAQIETAQREAIERQQAIEQRYAGAMKPIEELVAAWDFREASAALAKVQFEEEDLAARLTAWREGVKRLEDLKARIITKLNTADPRLKKSDLQIRGVGGEIVEADDGGIQVKLITGKPESLPWRDVGTQAIEHLIKLAGAADSPDARLAAGILCLAYNDPTSAEHHFDQARALGADIAPYVAPLAATAFAKAQDLLEAEKFNEAESLLGNIEAKYTDTPWFASNRAAFEAARSQAQAGIYEAEAEKLYAEAVELFKKEQRFDVKPIVEKLRTDYANSQPVTDTARKPSFADMEEAVADLGHFITVRQDGTADFTSIQAAIDAAPPNSLIEIQDNGPYNEKISIRQEGLTVRGMTGCCPIITSVGPVTNFPILVQIAAPRVTMERVVLSHRGAGGNRRHCVRGSVTMRSSIVDVSGRWGFTFYEGRWEIEECVVIAVGIAGELNVRNSVWLGAAPVNTIPHELQNVVVTGNFEGGPCTVGFCTIRGPLNLGRAPSRLKDSIVLSVQSSDAGVPIEHCDVYGNPAFIDQAKPGKGCFRADPQFRDPANLDYRLLPTSPCIGKASDGGDIGCRYTPEMMEMVQKALELRAKGIIKF